MGEVVSTIPKTEQGVTQAIIHSAINFRREPWPKVSDNAKDLVKKCLILVQSSILQYRKCLGPGVELALTYLLQVKRPDLLVDLQQILYAGGILA
ncbi:hypothetical protein PVK06_039737 [Gossypium arboreum]|uniref:Uncharacterized protein n=1 Tax=Gossypium arboreum TaxID=29729 RepID=A0ABR0N3P1_GOSAR|nr:hypothetical protein PVK06_039737 [Gossypium arboreum]